MRPHEETVVHLTSDRKESGPSGAAVALGLASLMPRRHLKADRRVTKHTSGISL